MEDAAIVSLFWQRDEEAIVASQQQYGSFLCHLAQNILNDRQDSEECLNDALRRAWEAIPPEKPDNLRAYFARIIRRLALNRLSHEQAQKRGGRHFTEELTDCLPGTASMDNAVDEHQLTELLQSWLEQLPEDDRLLFMKRYWFGESVNALSAESGETPGRLSGRLFRLRQKLRLVLEREEICI